MEFGGQNAAASAAPKDDAPFWIRWGGRIVGTIASVVAMITGVWAIISISPTCIVLAIYQILAGFFLALVEAPYLCFFVDFVQRISGFMDKRPAWNKAVLYVLVSLPPMIFCRYLANFLGCGLIFFTGVVYGLMSLGRKGSREDMAAAAAVGPVGGAQKTPGYENQAAWGQP